VQQSPCAFGRAHGSRDLEDDYDDYDDDDDDNEEGYDDKKDSNAIIRRTVKQPRQQRKPKRMWPCRVCSCCFGFFRYAACCTTLLVIGAIAASVSLVTGVVATMWVIGKDLPTTQGLE
jgi:hypothetical protein